MLPNRIKYDIGSRVFLNDLTGATEFDLKLNKATLRDVSSKEYPKRATVICIGKFPFSYSPYILGLPSEERFNDVCIITDKREIIYTRQEMLSLLSSSMEG